MLNICWDALCLDPRHAPHAIHLVFQDTAVGQKASRARWRSPSHFALIARRHHFCTRLPVVQPPYKTLEKHSSSLHQTYIYKRRVKRTRTQGDKKLRAIINHTHFWATNKLYILFFVDATGICNSRGDPGIIIRSAWR